jgi:hypothetical protein
MQRVRSRISILAKLTSAAVWMMLRAARFFLVQTYQNGKNIKNDNKLYQTAINYTKWPLNIPNGHKIYQHLPFKGPLKFTQIRDFWFENKPSGNPDDASKKLKNRAFKSPV